MKSHSKNQQAARRLIRNAARAIRYSAPLRQILFEKINRHERSAPVINETAAGLQDAGYSGNAGSLATHYSPRYLV
jgi:hypothetical protein